MIVNYAVTLADYKAALRLHRNLKLSRRLTFYVWFIAVPIIAALGAITFTVLNLSKLTRFAPLLFGIECGLVWISIYLPIWNFYSARKCVKQVFQEAGKERIIQLEVTDEFIYSTIPGVSEGKYFWNEKIGLAQNNKIVLIYVATKKFIPVPMSSLSPNHIADIQTMFERNPVRR